MNSSLRGFTASVDLNAIRLGIVAGFFACLAYPLMVFAHPPKLVTTTLAACFGPALAVACFGLRRLLDLEKPRLASALGFVLNAVAGALFSAMVLVQMAVWYSTKGEAVPLHVTAVWLGLDVAWDGYIGLGTFCFAIAMWAHPRYGRAYALSGAAIAIALLALNFYSFPEPPKSAGLIDLGPAVGLWYLLVTIQMWRSVGWARATAEQKPEPVA